MTDRIQPPPVRTESDEAEESRPASDLLPLVYASLRRVARVQMAKVPPGNTLQPTALVHEAYIRLLRHRSRWDSRGHFFVAAAEAMRRILVEQARRKATRKHGGSWKRVDAHEIEIPVTPPVDDVLALDQAIRRLQVEDPRKAKVAILRCFAGLNREEISEALEVSVPTVDRDWRFIVTRLRDELKGHEA